MNKERKREIGRAMLHIKLLQKKVKEWSKVLEFLKKRSSKINVDSTIKEAIYQRGQVRDEMKRWLDNIKSPESDSE